MNFRQLETFRCIATLGSFSAAAERLNSSQSTISSRIQELEQSLGVQLFDRSSRSVTLTARGRLLLHHAEEAALLASNIRREIAQQDLLSGRVRIGVGEIVALSWFPQTLSLLSETHPGIEIELVIDVSVNLVRLFDAGQLDLIFTVAPHMDPVTVSQHLGRAKMVWVASAADCNELLTPNDFAGKQIISLSRESHMFVNISEWLKKNDLKPKRIHGCNSITTIISLVKHRFGIALLPEALIQEELSTNVLKIAPISPAVSHYDFYMSYKREAADATVIAVADASFETTTFEGRTDEYVGT